MAELLYEILQNEPNIEEINLDYKDIDDLEELLPILSKFENLRLLSLADNRITTFPEDLSWLTNVEDINLNGNVFQDLKQVIIALTTMPNLRSLHINLHEEEQVDFIFRNMPNLEMLNDTEVEREDDGQMMGEDSQQSEEQSDQPQQIEGEEDIEPEEMPPQHLPQELEAEGEQEVEEPQEAEGEDQNQMEGLEDLDDLVIKPEDLEIIAVLYDSIRALRRRIDEENDK
jgi:hypothetical protein